MKLDAVLQLLHGEDSFAPPFRYQNAINDCAPACVLALAEHYGIATSIHQLRNRLDAEATIGVRVSAFERGLSDLFSVTTGKISKDDLGGKVLPCIAYLQDERHFVVIWKRLKNGKVLIGDPGLGLHAQKEEEFSARWSGIVILLRPLQSREKQKRKQPSPFSSTYQLFSGGFSGTIWLSIFSFLRGGSSTAFSVALPLCLDNFQRLATLSAGFFLLSILLGYTSTIISSATKRRFLRVLGQKVVGKMPYMDRRYYTVGDVYSRFQDAQSVVEVLTLFIRDVPYIFALAIGAGIYLVRLDWTFAAAISLLTIAVIAALDPCIDAARSLTYRIRLTTSKLNNEVRRMWEQDEGERIERTWKSLIDAGFSQALWSAPAVSVIAQFLPFSIAVFAIWEARFGSIAVATSNAMLTILTILNYFVSAINSLYTSYVQWQTVEPALYRVKDFLDQPAYPNVPRAASDGAVHSQAFSQCNNLVTNGSVPSARSANGT